MPTDYHIYIHSDKADESSKKTQPKEVEFIADDSIDWHLTGLDYLPTSIKEMGGNAGVAALTTVSAVTAAVTVVAKTTIHTLKTGFAHQQEYTGFYENNVNLNNFLSVVNGIVNPIGTATQIAHKTFEINKQNIAIQQQNTLIGNSIVKEMKLGS